MGSVERLGLGFLVGLKFPGDRLPGMEAVSEFQLREMAGHLAGAQGVLFVGAGVSAAAGAPTWNELTEPLRNSRPATSESSPLLLAQFFRNQLGDHELFSYLRKALGNLQPAPVHSALCALPIRAVVTTNYDTLLETAYRQENRPCSRDQGQSPIGLWNEAEEVQLLKLHGDIDSAGSIVLTEQDYFRFMHGHPAFKRKLCDSFCHRTVLFIGFSMRDPKSQCSTTSPSTSSGRHAAPRLHRDPERRPAPAQALERGQGCGRSRCTSRVRAGPPRC